MKWKAFENLNEQWCPQLKDF